MEQKILRDYFKSAPPACCASYEAGGKIAVKAKGEARNKFYLQFSVPTVVLETDDAVFRFPPEKNREACDWCVFSQQSLHAAFVELKSGCNQLEHALVQLESTMRYMQQSFSLAPKLAFAVFRGSCPRNARPGAESLKEKFRRKFPGVRLSVKSAGDSFSASLI